MPSPGELASRTAVAAAVLSAAAASAPWAGLPSWAGAAAGLAAAGLAGAAALWASRGERQLLGRVRELAGIAPDQAVQDPLEAAARRSREDREARERALGLLESFPFPAMTLTRAGTLRWMNRSMAGVLGTPPPARGAAMDPLFFASTSAGGWEALRGDARTEDLLRFTRGEAFFLFQCVVQEVGDNEDRWLVMLVDMTSSNMDAERLAAQQAEIRQLARKIRGTTARLEQDARAISETLQRLVDTMADSQGQARQVSCAMQEMTDNVRMVATVAAQSHATSSEAEGSAREGMEEVRHTAQVTRKVVDSYAGLQAIMTQLVERGGRIRNVTQIISDIADQTNLLALNAAIEAARAGESGRGFAVVADEVRKLAEKTLAATREVHEAVGAIDASSHEALEAMNATKGDIENASGLVHDVEERFSAIAKAMVETSQAIGDIARRAESQCASSFEINMCAMNVTDNSEEVTETVGETSRELKALVEEAANVRDLAGRYLDGGNDESEHRAHDRIYVKAYASRLTCRVDLGGRQAMGEVLDVSPGGVRLRLLEEAQPREGGRAALAACSCKGDLGLDGRAGVVRWCSGRDVGLEFDNPLPYSAGRLQALVAQA
ncbi:Methyl-accepting chemotaxis protein McpQ [Fundidesulfovibrio magnetotacticus]|uniref:Methyl-accepting chemotaxis protein McpQ n=1 Tax=Fundidesulfovibrio magnetotacticus TaxID=2730080 RepID=A0A6V8LMF8_9BACT|nr:methyl-accepting chemotaxis protein [Fundidesulfovibrio magnetotacticus]GFK93862.1 Methyl-accepting chemotaxis protein McpQ [Fundidesulfovibrio magnetotacticus]